MSGHLPKQFHFFALHDQQRLFTNGKVFAVGRALRGVCRVGLTRYCSSARSRNADQGTPKMQKVAAAIRAGAEAYLGQQFRKDRRADCILTVVLFLTALSERCRGHPVAPAFLMGSLFSFAVGFVGMRFATPR